MNPITQELSDYLIASGFYRKPARPGFANFIKGDRWIHFSLDEVQVLHYHDGDEDTQTEWIVGQRHVGGSIIRTFAQWAVLLDMMDAVSLKENEQKVRNQSVNQLFQPLINAI